MESPFKHKAPGKWYEKGYLKPGEMLETVAVEDRLRMVQKMDADRLRAVIAWPRTQITVKMAAIRRLKNLDPFSNGNPSRSGTCW